MRKFYLKGCGFWTKEGIVNMPVANGIYFVYRGILTSDNEVDIKELIYIGKADQEGGVRSRLTYHEKMPDFEKQIRRGEILVFSCAPLIAFVLDRVENALIFTQQPILNDKGTKSFNYPDTEICLSDEYAQIVEGEWKYLNKSIIINTHK